MSIGYKFKRWKIKIKQKTLNNIFQKYLWDIRLNCYGYQKKNLSYIFGKEWDDEPLVVVVYLLLLAFSALLGSATAGVEVPRNNKQLESGLRIQKY